MKTQSIVVFVLSLVSASNNKRPPRIVTLTAAPTHHPIPTNVTILPNIIGRHNAYILNISQNSIFSIQAPLDEELQVVSQQAQQHDCNDVAINGGPFQSSGELVGGVIINNTIVSNDFSLQNVGFGYSSNTKKWILGGIQNTSEAQQLQVQYYVTGLFGWLVYKGQVVVQTSNRIGNKDKNRAPRTAIGVDKHGHFLILVVDGCEACFTKRGFNLHELATLFQQHGVYHAINLDGGSSTTLVYRGSVINIPTCHDVQWKCERPVATIVCLQQQHNVEESSDSNESNDEEEDAQ